MSNPEVCKFLRLDGTCTIAPRPTWAFALGTYVLFSADNRPSQANLLLEAIDGQRYACAGRQGLGEANRIRKQKSCDQYQRRG